MLEPYRMIVVNLIASGILGCGLIFYKYVYPKKNISLSLILILVSILPIISILRKGTYGNADLTTHTAYSIYFYENLKAGNIIPVWSSLSCGGYGCPIFEFLYILPYYLSAFFHNIGFSFLNSTKLVFMVSYILSGITMYMWGKDQFGKIPGFVTAIFYLFAPYHLITLHFRASVGEMLSFVFVPLVFLFTKKIITDPKIKWVVLQAISLTLLILSHFAAFISSLYVILPYAFLLWFLQKPRRFINLKYYGISMILGFLLSLYKWLPALLEVRYTWFRFESDMLTFVPLKSLLISPTNFGLLFQGNNGELNLIFGYMHIILIVMLAIFIFKKKLVDKEAAIGVWLLLSFAIIVFLILPQSKFIWHFLNFMGGFQFSWRLLTIVAFITSAAAGLVATKIKKNEIIIALCAVTILSTILNWGNRKMVSEDKSKYLNDTALYSEYYEQSNPEYQTDYIKRVGQIPQLAANHPQKPLEIISGKADIALIARTPTNHEYIINTTTASWLKENTYYFPGWTLTVNNKSQKIYYKEPKYKGTLVFFLNKGLYDVKFTFTDTPVRYLSKIISFIFFLFMSIYFLIVALKKYKYLL